jgi:integrase
MRLDVFLALMGDKPIDAFKPRDLQLYVNTLQYLPVEFGRDGKHSPEIRSIGPRAAVERNAVERCWEPLSRKTLEDGYLQVFKAVVNDCVRNHSLPHHPFAGARIAWPKFAKPSVSREALDDETVNRVFSLGVASGYLDDALLPALSLTSSRRIGLLAFVRGSDLERKHGVVVCRVDGIVYDPERKTWFRVPYKTRESLSYFVVHDIWSQAGFVDWAMAQGDAFLFRQLHATKDPADALSKRMNRLLRRAGAKGKNIEVAHSFRHGAKNLMVDDEIGDGAVRKQMGHAPSADAHTGYGSRTELQRTECQALASLPLPTSIDWTAFRRLDFEAMASKPRGRGKGVRSMLNEGDDA